MSNGDLQQQARAATMAIRLVSLQRRNERIQPDVLRGRLATMSTQFKEALNADTQLYALETQIPVTLLHERAERSQEHQRQTDAPPLSGTDTPVLLTYADHLMDALLDWYKNEYMAWVDTPACAACGAPNTKHGNGRHAAPTAQERAGGAARVELYVCKECNGVTRFARYNSLHVLMQERRGRCGEWAWLFCLFSAALGFDTRYVLDYTDHVWCEFWCDTRARWVHVDPSEGPSSFDSPLMYAVGWRKALNYVFAVAEHGVADVVRRYTDPAPAAFARVLRRRTLAREASVAALVAGITARLRRDAAPALRLQLAARDALEHEDLLHPTPRKPRPDEKKGRSSGNLEWRLARGETSAVPLLPVSLSDPSQSDGVFSLATTASASNSANNSVSPSLVGSALFAPPTCKILLTPHETDKRGAFWVPISVTKNSSQIITNFTFRAHGPNGADGLALVLQSTSPTVLGNGGSGLGYAGFPNIAVEFDMYASRDTCRDPDDNHVSIHTRGPTTPNSAHHMYSYGCSSRVMDLASGQNIRVSVVWNIDNEEKEEGNDKNKVGGNDSVQVFMGDHETDNLVLIVEAENIDVKSFVHASGGCWVGVTAATGGLCQVHEVLAFDVFITSNK
ncbi:peptide-N4-(N-acetyl-beta- glucosaminyl)asparagine amidase [Physocladia obscura]|uniref:Peptide-N4-(N-acetyl-beta-glucosaminyl)asparagine amidase n=1 Tax=Physocladia obscura TaxID=109957 RepID=A0AAD5T6C0_9FUNG|nr:peptide-N4-(N-acetyl-beta- glucosaminyl)asparagine amidase [Physocladia obscura]